MVKVDEDIFDRYDFGKDSGLLGAGGYGTVHLGFPWVIFERELFFSTFLRGFSITSPQKIRGIYIYIRIYIYIYI